MARGNGKVLAYAPDEATRAMVASFLDGNADDATRETLSQIYQDDAGFRSWFDGERLARRRRRAAFGNGGGGNEVFGAANGARPAVVVGGNGAGRALPGVERHLQQQGNRAAYAGSPSSPGGFKKSGLDADSALRRSGTMTPDSVLRNVGVDGLDFGADGGLTNKTAVRFGNRTYGRRQIESVVARGMSGATMDWRDQALYDAFVKKQAERQKEAKLAAEQRKLELAAERQAAAQREEAERKEAQRRAKNREYGVPEDVNLTEKEMDDLRKGSVRWGLPKREEAERRKVEDELARIASDPSTDPKDIAALREKAAAYKARFVPRLTDVEPDERTPRQKFEQNVVEVEDPNAPGRKVKFVLDKDGRATRLDFGTAPKAERPAEETFKGFTFKDFVNAMPKTRAGAADPDTGEASVEEIPFLERLRMAEEAWAKRNGDAPAPTGGQGQEPPPQTGGQDAPETPRPTEISAAEDWRSFFAGNGASGANATAAQTQTATPETQTAQEPQTGQEPPPQTGGAACPECGAALAPDGSCPFCGWNPND